MEFKGVEVRLESNEEWKKFCEERKRISNVYGKDIWFEEIDSDWVEGSKSDYNWIELVISIDDEELFYDLLNFLMMLYKNKL